MGVTGLALFFKVKLKLFSCLYQLSPKNSILIKKIWNSHWKFTFTVVDFVGQNTSKKKTARVTIKKTLPVRSPVAWPRHHPTKKNEVGLRRPPNQVPQWFALPPPWSPTLTENVGVGRIQGTWEISVSYFPTKYRSEVKKNKLLVPLLTILPIQIAKLAIL